MSIVVGKNVLESLTTGMYSDNRIVYREYIQNASDSLDRAVRDGILAKDEASIDITLNVNRREIRIRDNGSGIVTKHVHAQLGDIGKSSKNYKEQRGFRGIGRLGGLGYCEEVRFVTSAVNEPLKTIVSWDCVKLRKLLQPHVEPDLDVVEVVRRVTMESSEKEAAAAHYFEVILTGVDKGHDNLLDLENIKDYLSQVAPVPFNHQKFTELRAINQKLLELGKPPEEYTIVLNQEQVFKPYARKLAAANKEKDFVEGLEFFEGNHEGKLFFLGWYGKTCLSGMIKDQSVAGLRVRKRNVLIGDSRTLDEFFGQNRTYQNFNRWFIGEIYVFHHNLIPNSRRDSFEQNETYFDFKQEVEKTTRDKLAKLPHTYSGERSERKSIDVTRKDVQAIKEEMTKGITTVGKERIIKKIEKIESTLKKVTGKTASHDRFTCTEGNTGAKKVLKEKEQILKEVETLRETVATSKNFKSSRIPSSYPKEVRTVVERIFEVIDQMLPEGQAYELQEGIIDALQIKGKRK
ncbi:MAG: ATP-binding protein [Syntrophobacteraceae bacterium]